MTPGRTIDKPFYAGDLIAAIERLTRERTEQDRKWGYGLAQPRPASPGAPGQLVHPVWFVRPMPGRRQRRVFSLACRRSALCANWRRSIIASSGETSLQNPLGSTSMRRRIDVTVPDSAQSIVEVRRTVDA
jgi:hypothetical protein